MRSELEWRIAIAALTMFLFGLLFGWSIRNAVGQEVIDLHDHRVAAPIFKQYPPPTSKADPYSGILNKDKVNCCNGQDCRMMLGEHDFVIKMEGGYILKATGEFIPELKVAPSPDENWHICRKSDTKKTVRCLMIPPGGV